MTYLDCLNEGIKVLSTVDKDDAEFDARELLIYAANISRTKYFSSMNETVEETVVSRYFELIEERKKGNPLQYIIGSWDFYGLEFWVGPGVLIPRPETEMLVELAVSHLKETGVEKPVVFDLCAGTGCVGVSIASEVPNARVFEFEFSNSAFPYLEKNLLDNCTAIKYDVLKGPEDFLKEYGITPDIIVSNPPYIRTEEIESLQKEVLKEPVMALDGGADGLIFYRNIADEWLSVLNENGGLFVECGEDQTEDIDRLFSAKIYNNFANKFTSVFKLKDFAGNYRVVVLK